MSIISAEYWMLIAGAISGSLTEEERARLEAIEPGAIDRIEADRIEWERRRRARERKNR